MTNAQTVIMALLSRRFHAYTPPWAGLIFRLRRDNRLDSATDAEVDSLIAAGDFEIEDLWALPEDQAQEKDFERLHMQAANDIEKGRARVRRHIQSAEAYREELTAMSEEEVLRLRDEAAAEDARYVEAESIEFDKWQFYSSETASADFDYWANLDIWTPEEATALSFGKSPNVVNSRLLEKSKSVMLNSRFLSEYKRRLTMIERASEARKFGEHLNAITFSKWASTVGLELELGESLERLKPSTDELDLSEGHSTRGSTNSYRTAIKFLLGIALSRYGFDRNYNPKEAGTSAVTDMVSDIVAAGLVADPQTLRKYLIAALEFADAKNISLKPFSRGRATVQGNLSSEGNSTKS